ncbi:MAG TPA: hypothetical protein VHB79_38845 [Polyangiaceae bacterium]|nr:hypothetical protein [Polyangiaceae bacterium]
MVNLRYRKLAYNRVDVTVTERDEVIGRIPLERAVHGGWRTDGLIFDALRPGARELMFQALDLATSALGQSRAVFTP